MGDKLAQNSLAVTILPDGRLRVETGSFAGAAHASADQFMRVLLAELGVSVEERTAIGHVHHHEHDHEQLAAKGGANK
jgi:hypothetical protein